MYWHFCNVSAEDCQENADLRKNIYESTNEASFFWISPESLIVDGSDKNPEK